MTDFDLRDAGKVSMYACGPTVYDVPHIGNGRMVLVFDVLRRYLEWSGLDVRFVSNITDIDDTIIRRAHDADRSSSEAAVAYEAACDVAPHRLGATRPPGATPAPPPATPLDEGTASLVAPRTAH